MARDLTLVTFGNGVPMSLRVARRLAETGIGARVLDLRWLAPLPVDDLLRDADATGRVLVVDETRRSGGVSEAVITALADAGYGGRTGRVTAVDSFIPLGDRRCSRAGIRGRHREGSVGPAVAGAIDEKAAGGTCGPRRAEPAAQRPFCLCINEIALEPLTLSAGANVH